MPVNVPTPLSLILLSVAESIVSLSLFPHFANNRPFSAQLLIFLVLSFGCWATWLILIYPFFISPLRHLPRPKGGSYPLIGHGYLMFSRPPGNYLLEFIKEVPNDGIICFRGFLHVDRLVLTDPKSLADVLVHNSYDFEKPIWVRNFLRQFLGDGLLMTEGEEHKFQRKHIMPAFSFRHIKELYPIFWQKAIELTRSIAAEMHENPETPTSETNGNPSSVIEVNHWASKVTMDIIGLAGLGRDIQALKNSDDDLIKNYEEILEPTAEKAIYFALNMIFPQRLINALPWKVNERVRVTSSNLKTICRNFVREKKQRMKTESEEQVDILSVLIKSNDFSDDSLVDQLLTFLAAGHETTSSALTWTTYLLSLHPKIQTRLRKEIHTALPSLASPIDPNLDLPSLLESLPLLNAICNESLRLFPTIPATSRVSTRNTTICGHFIPAGTLCFMSPWAVNRSPSLWGPDAEEFRPERWIDPETGHANNTGGATSNYSLLTFLHGPRSCIGEKFARAELRVLVAVFVGVFEMEMANPGEVVKVAGTITAKPKNGMRLRLRKAEGW
ncbi:putative P450 monooxygenase [Lepidopterella palustris CBS 459.81]|uniref:Putative P450 monooxygenase n=1 Tax=Lepidopterella palustris CBS 459.81 TaxID=1314670 RepID=A0A8E2ECL4_9PEZI|nr:putative P450 monooxygenase [Lepidopterella palustris CBS 459.81]